MLSTQQKIAKLEGCLDTGDLTPAQEDFVRKLVRMRDAQQVDSLTEKQLDYLNGLYDRHFA